LHYFKSDVVLAFANPKENDGRDSVEILAVDEKGGSKLQSAEIVFSSEKPTYRKNPAECRACHGNPLRFIWDEYGYWRFTYDSSHREVPKDSKEWREYLSFRKSQSHHPLYSQLIPFLETDEGEDKRDLKFNIDQPIEHTGFGTLEPGNKYLSATSSFHNLLIREHGNMVKALFRKNNQSEIFAFAIAGLELCRGNYENFFPEKWRSAARSKDQIRANLKSGIEKYNESVASARKKAFGDVGDEYATRYFQDWQVDHAVNQIYLAERMGVPTASLFTVIRSEFSPVNMWEIFHSNEVDSAGPKELAEDGVLAKLKPIWLPGDLREKSDLMAKFCKELAAESVKSLEKHAPPERVAARIFASG